MASDSGRARGRVDSDGRIMVNGSRVRLRVWLAVCVLGLAGVALFDLTRSVPQPVSDESAGVGAPPAQAPAALRSSHPVRGDHIDQPLVPPRRLPLRPEPHALNNAAAPPPPAAAPPQDELPAAQQEAGDDEATGLALFPPPGTQALQRGIIVHEGFELPPGYVRHYQATDDGERVPAILMFHPDFKLVDENGRPVPLPADRIVPPEMAPPGMPIQMLEVPDDPDRPAAENPAEQDAVP